VRDFSKPMEIAMTDNTEHTFKDTNRHLVEVPDSFAIARWRRDADVSEIATCILGTLKFEPHAKDVSALRAVLEDLIDHEIAIRLNALNK